MFSKITSYGINRIQNEQLRKDQNAFMMSRGRRALDAIKPSVISLKEIKSAWDGSPQGDGSAKFSQAMVENGWDDASLSAVISVHRQDFHISLACAALCAGFGIWLVIAGGSFFAILVLAIFMIGFCVKAFASDYAAFQIKNRRFCSLKTYLQDGFFSPSSDGSDRWSFAISRMAIPADDGREEGQVGSHGLEEKRERLIAGKTIDKP